MTFVAKLRTRPLAFGLALAGFAAGAAASAALAQEPAPAPAAPLSGTQPVQGTVFHATIQVGRRLPGLVPGAPETDKRLLNNVLGVGPTPHPLAGE